jgi:KTSC domain
MDRLAVTSESLASVGYDEARRLLEVEFSSGEVYRYYDVPPAVYEQLMRADSHGRYFIANVRSRYRYLRLSAPRRRSRGRS